ncbi:hypothetical protein MQM1_087 [Aeromonas phage vB_AsaP_MQM1]|nr:hypothetical protein MQM1_087 [Aeromonas phage vB_AsaP_MQM1]
MKSDRCPFDTPLHTYAGFMQGVVRYHTGITGSLGSLGNRSGVSDKW